MLTFLRYIKRIKFAEGYGIPHGPGEGGWKRPVEVGDVEDGHAD